MVLILLAGVGFLYEKREEISPVAMGGALIESSGCYACHGRGEGDPRVNFRQSASGSRRPRSIPTFWENGIDDPAVLKEWIRDGHPADEASRHRSLFIQMPAYGGRFLTEGEIDAVVAWILAEGFRLTGGMGNGDAKMPSLDMAQAAALSAEDALLLGDRLARKQACYQCHGELGQGGVSNPASFKAYIPGFWGRDFRELTDGGSREEILHWIDHGRGRAIEEGVTGPLAKRYFDGQAIAMPAYADLISESEKAVLVDFLLLLNDKGPLASAEIAEIIDSISQMAQNEQRN